MTSRFMSITCQCPIININEMENADYIDVKDNRFDSGFRIGN